MISTRMSIGIRTVTILTVLLFVAVVYAMRSDLGTTFATYSGGTPLELKIDSKTIYNGVFQPKLSWAVKNLVPTLDRFFYFLDVKPGDTGKNTISLHVSGPAWICLDFKNYTEAENGINEPESHVDGDSTGELGEHLEFFAWRDDGDDTYEVGESSLFGTSSQTAVQVLNEKTYAFADSLNGPAVPGNQTKYIGILWCAGDLSVNTATAVVSCNGAVMGNESQTDSLTVDISIRAVSSKNQPNFVCGKPPVIVNKCEIEGHKFDKYGKPLANWSIGLSKKITHNNGIDIYDLATSTTDANGFYCLEWDGYTQSLRPSTTASYISGSYNFTYNVFEVLKDGWKNVSIKKGATASTTVVVPIGDIATSGKYVSVQMGVQNGYIYANEAYHIDFYNATTKPVLTLEKKKKGNNGHGNDPDHNDNSNPGKSNTESDTTDADGVPGKSGQKNEALPLTSWTVKESNSNPISALLKNLAQKVTSLGKKS